MVAFSLRISEMFPAAATHVHHTVALGECISLSFLYLTDTWRSGSKVAGVVTRPDLVLSEASEAGPTMGQSVIWRNITVHNLTTWNATSGLKYKLLN